MNVKPQRVRYRRQCRRCRRTLLPGGYMYWVADDVLFPELPRNPGGYCCLNCARFILGTTLIKVPA